MAGSRSGGAEYTTHGEACRDPHPGSAREPVAHSGALTSEVDAIYPDIESLYKDLHQNPELGFQEPQTAAKLAARLKALGFDVTTGVGKTGIVAILKNGAGRP